MGDPPLPVSGAASVLSRTDDDPQTAVLSKSTQITEASDVIEVLRRAVADGSSKDSIFSGIADAARVLSGAHGTALASRLNGMIVCQARSGDMAPPLGAPLNSDSGISGECLRTAETLVCNDAFTDQRVDAEVCRGLGIRSIAVVPMRGPTGVVGILEAFSEIPAAFDEEKICSLQDLAEIAKTAYERETRVPLETPAKSRPALFAPPVAPTVVTRGRHNLAIALAWFGSLKQQSLPAAKRYWIPTAAVLAVLLIALVVRLSWRQSNPKIATDQVATHSSATPTLTVDASQPAFSPKQNAGIPRRETDRSPIKSPLRNAADIQPARDNVPASTTSNSPSLAAAPANTPAKASPNDEVESPPSIELAGGNVPNQLIQLAAGSEQLPQFGAPISQGLIEPVLVRKVSPTYPPQARVQKITGSVVLDATVETDGSIRKIKIVSGPPILASAAASALGEWHYTPALLNGKRIATQQRITMVFKLP